MKNIRIIFSGSDDVEQEIRSVLRSPDRIELVASSDNPTARFALLEQHSPEVLLLEKTLSESATLSQVKSVREQYPRIKLLILAHNFDISHVQEMINIGVSGYLLLGPSLEGLEASIRLVKSGKLTLSSEIAQALRSGE